MSIRFGAAMGLLEGAGAFKYAGKLAKTGWKAMKGTYIVRQPRMKTISGAVILCRIQTRVDHNPTHPGTIIAWLYFFSNGPRSPSAVVKVNRVFRVMHCGTGDGLVVWCRGWGCWCRSCREGGSLRRRIGKTTLKVETHC
jgi:hypothetical protein